MVRGGSVSKKTTASTMITGCGTSNALQSHSKYPNECGQPSQNGNDAQMETHNQITDRKPKRRARGLPTVCRVTHPPRSTMSECEFMQYVRVGLHLCQPHFCDIWRGGAGQVVITFFILAWKHLHKHPPRKKLDADVARQISTRAMFLGCVPTAFPRHSPVTFSRRTVVQLSRPSKH